MPFNQNQSISGLQSVVFPIPATGPYVIDGKISLPSLSQGGAASACVATVVQNSTTIYTGIAGAEGLHVELAGVLNDVITVTLSSSNAADQAPNAVKCVLGISNGVS